MPVGYTRPDSDPGSPLVPFSILPASYEVSGGVGGISYGLAELSRAAAELLAISRDAGEIRCRAAGQLGALLELAYRPGSMYPATAAESLRIAIVALDQNESELEESASSLRRAVERYAGMEQTALAAVHSAKSLSAWRDGFLLRLGLVTALLPPLPGRADGGRGAATRQGGMGDRLEDAINTSPEFVGGVLGLPPGLMNLFLQSPSWGGLQRTPLAVRLAAEVRNAGDRFLFTPGQLKVERAAATQEESEAVSPSLEDMFSGVRDAYGTGPSGPGADGTAEVRLRKVDRGDGSFAVIVDIPGTEVWLPPDSESLFDLEGDLEAATSGNPAFARRQALVQQLVREALRDAGTSAHDLVVLNGHSGGGMHALALASDPAFLAEFNVRMVNVAGAPAGFYHPGPNVRILALENADDPVPAVDGSPNPTGRNIVTVRTPQHAGAESLPLGRKIIDAHGIDGYRRDARLLDTCTDASVQAHRAELASILGPLALNGTARVQRFSYRGRDPNGRALSGSRKGAPRRTEAVLPPRSPRMPGMPQ